MDEVVSLIQATQLFTNETIVKEVEWFYGQLGLHDFYFSGQSPAVIATHIQRYVHKNLIQNIRCTYISS